MGIADAPRVVIDTQGRKLGNRWFSRGGEGPGEMATWITEKPGAEPGTVSGAIDMPHGPVVERGFRVRSINPEQFDRFRDRFSPARPRTTAVTCTCWLTRCGRTRAACTAWSR